MKPVSVVQIYKDGKDWSFYKLKEAKVLKDQVFAKEDSVCLDFGTHCVGYVRLNIIPVGSPPDAPAYIRLKFGEHICEIAENSADYNGLLSSSWIQEEYIHIDVLPAVIELPRRYAFRFMEIYVKDTSSKYKIRFENIVCKTVSSANVENVPHLNCSDSMLDAIDHVSVKTMCQCMQDVFEDGPKRDRRLWIGDLRLQALTNYETFKNYDLVKRCLYLFAGLRQNDGRVGACLFTEPKPHVDDTWLFDYSLLFISCLYDYYFATKYLSLVCELWDTAYRQIEIAQRFIDENGVVKDRNDWWCSVDWNESLNKQASAHAIFIYTLKQAKYIAELLNDNSRLNTIEMLIRTLEYGALKVLWDEEKGFFISGEERQISWASQVWFVLAGVFDKEKNARLLRHLIDMQPNVKMITPYMYHYFVEALLDSEMSEEAMNYIKSYWGGMVADGADCFYELYNPDNKYESPYGSRIINSYCHAWSGTPAYFIRKYFASKVDF